MNWLLFSFFNSHKHWINAYFVVEQMSLTIESMNSGIIWKYRCFSYFYVTGRSRPNRFVLGFTLKIS